MDFQKTCLYELSDWQWLTSSIMDAIIEVPYVRELKVV